MRIFTIVSLLTLIALAAACGRGGGTPLPAKGSISGEINVIGPASGAAELRVGMFAPGGQTPLDSAVAGRVTSAAQATLTDRRISFSFTELDFGTYEVALFAESAGATTFYFRSAAQTISSASPSVSGFSAQASFTGDGPFGTVSGVVLLEEDFAFTPGRIYFIGFAPAAQPQRVLQHIVGAADVNSSRQLFYNVEGIAYGSWLVGLYGYNPQTHEVTVHGLLDSPVAVNAQNVNITGAIFAAGLTDPGSDPELGTISGTVTFNGALPEGQSLHVAANTIPPQQGAPPATVEINPADVGSGRTFNYVLPNLPDGQYSVAVFSYDFVNHKAVYFGQYEGSLTISAEARHAGGVDFEADVTVIGGSAD